MNTTAIHLTGLRGEAQLPGFQHSWPVDRPCALGPDVRLEGRPNTGAAGLEPSIHERWPALGISGWRSIDYFDLERCNTVGQVGQWGRHAAHNSCEPLMGVGWIALAALFTHKTHYTLYTIHIQQSQLPSCVNFLLFYFVRDVHVTLK